MKKLYNIKLINNHWREKLGLQLTIKYMIQYEIQQSTEEV